MIASILPATLPTVGKLVDLGVESERKKNNLSLEEGRPREYPATDYRGKTRGFMMKL